MFGQSDNTNQSAAFDPSTAPLPSSSVMPDPLSVPGTMTPADPNPAPSAPAMPEPASAVPSTGVPGSDELLDLKQQALQQLSPLVSHLEQTPEEKFRTTMMMIQASDNQELVKEAFEAAKQITDDKARAQALLDVINEINYFTQQHNNQPSA